MITFYKETNFKETTIGKIPKDWAIVKAEDIFSLEYGKGLSEKERMIGQYPVCGSNGVIGYHNQFLVKGPGIVIGRKGTMGAVTWMNSCFWPIDTTYFVRVKRDNIFVKWLFFKLVHMNLKKLTLSDVVPGLKRSLVHSLRMALPPPHEQQKIAEVLSTVDEAIERTSEVIAKTERLKKGLMQELLTKGIGHKEFKDTEIGRIPKDWGVVRLGDVAQVVSGFGFPLTHQGKKTGKYPFIKVNDLNSAQKYVTSADKFVNDEDLKALKAKVFPPNTVVFPKIGMATYLNKFRMLKKMATFDNNVAGVIPNTIEPEFLFYYFLGRVDLKQLSGRTTAPSIRKSTLELILLPLPPRSEQQQIAEILSTVDKKLELERSEKARLERIKQGLMDLLLTGKVRVKVN